MAMADNEADAGRRRPLFPNFPAFAARAPWWGGDLQTIRNAVLRPRSVLNHTKAYRLRFPMNDGTGDVLLGLLNEPPASADRPLAILLHGLTGCESSFYMEASAVALLAEGYPVLRLNLRGAGPSRDLCREQYHAGRTGDLSAVIERLRSGAAEGRERKTFRNFVLIGYSLGANMLLKFLGERGGAARAEGILAAVSVSAPIDLKATSRRFLAWRNAAYHRYLLGRMKRETLANASALTERERDIVRTVRTTYAFDDLFVAPRNGWPDADTYYTINSAIRFLDGIMVPTLIVHARNDPWIPVDPYLAHPWAGNPNLTPLLSEGGGHVGFHGAGTQSWHDRCAILFLDAVRPLPDGGGVPSGKAPCQRLDSSLAASTAA